MCVPEEEAFTEFLKYLEKSKNRTRPAYDGIALVFQDEDLIPVFFRFLSRNNHRDRFWRVVSSIGSVYTYVRFSMKSKPGITNALQKSKEEGDLLATLYSVIFRLRLNTKKMLSDLKANNLYQILLKALDSIPNYSSFFKVRFFLLL